MRTVTIILLGLCSIGISNDIKAQTAPNPERAAVIEARLVRDSGGCPYAVDVWLVSTTDTIQGFEAVLQWNRADQVEFTRGQSDAAKKKPADSLSAMLQPADPKTQVRIDRTGTIISGWEFVEARSLDGQSTKILAVAKLFGQAEPEPILPGRSGALLRVPISRLASGVVSDSGTATLVFNPDGTRLSTHRGALFGTVKLNSISVDVRNCPKRSPKK